MPDESLLERWAGTAASVFEIAGVAVMLVGLVVATLMTLKPHAVVLRDRLRDFRQRLGQAIVLGLELLVAADILRTITASPTLKQVGVLASIVVVRTFLSWSLEVELEGRWPWQARPH